jgi:threonine/homoserine/homoserine lactone efflux protein
MDFIPSLDVLAMFTVASLVLIFTPGPDMTFFLGQTLRSGRLRGFAAMLGACTGLLGHAMLAAFGLSTLLLASATAFTLVKIAGAVYLLWLAVQALRHGSALTLSATRGERRPLGRVFVTGIGINLLNPKVVMFFVTFLPQFVSANDTQASEKLLFLGLYFIAVGIPACGLLILAADRFTHVVRRSPRALRAIDYLFASLMGAFAVRLLFSRANQG